MHLHNLKTILDTAEVKIDVCTECHAKKFYRKDANEQIDNKTYLEDHQRNFLQPDNKLYYRYHKEAPNLFEANELVEKEFKKDNK